MTVSPHGCIRVIFTGTAVTGRQVGDNISEEDGAAAARLVALNMLATLKCESLVPYCGRSVPLTTDNLIDVSRRFFLQYSVDRSIRDRGRQARRQVCGKSTYQSRSQNAPKLASAVDLEEISLCR